MDDEYRAVLFEVMVSGGLDPSVSVAYDRMKEIVER
jgi:hypothetical protein